MGKKKVTLHYDIESNHSHKQSSETGQTRSVLYNSASGLQKVYRVYSIDGNRLNPGKLNDGNRAVNVYSENGTLIKAISFRNGFQNGPSKYYDQNGRMIMSGELRNGLAEVQWFEYDLHGIVIQKSEYKAGTLIDTKAK